MLPLMKACLRPLADRHLQAENIRLRRALSEALQREAFLEAGSAVERLQLIRAELRVQELEKRLQHLR